MTDTERQRRNAQRIYRAAQNFSFFVHGDDGWRRCGPMIYIANRHIIKKAEFRVVDGPVVAKVRNRDAWQSKPTSR